MIFTSMAMMFNWFYTLPCKFGRHHWVPLDGPGRGFMLESECSRCWERKYE